jgi:distribution and morphology protein 12
MAALKKGTGRCRHALLNNSMSIELEWQKLNSSLATTLVDILNRQLTTTQRPSFIGPVEISSFDFGTVPPDVELVDLRDIYRDFLEDSDPGSDSEADHENVKVTEGAAEDEDGFEWVSRKAARRGLADDGPAYHHLPPHIRYGHSPSVDLFTSTPALHTGTPRDMWSGGAMHMSTPSLGDFRPMAGMSATPSMMGHRSPFPLSPERRSVSDSASQMPRTSMTPDQSSPSPPDPPSSHSHSDPAPAPVPSPDSSDLQLHLYLNWHSNLRLTLTTSLLINYPSPSFMSLPIKLSVAGLVFTGEVAVAYEGSRGRVHLCVLDDLDPYGPACRRPRSQTSTPPDIDDDSGKRDGKPLPVGQRLLPSILIESEIGQADKHVLKNVTRVERFIQDVIRKTVEEELVFPNFHTLIIGDQGRS